MVGLYAVHMDVDPRHYKAYKNKHKDDDTNGAHMGSSLSTIEFQLRGILPSMLLCIPQTGHTYQAPKGCPTRMFRCPPDLPQVLNYIEGK